VLALKATLLAGCASSDLSPPPAAVTLPPVPADLRGCLERTFPDIPATAFGSRQAVRIIAEAKLLDRAKTACGLRAVAWIEGVVQEYGR
jgi:hypothetical protein